jgi:hypothetical protein
MSENARIVTTDVEIDTAIQDARLYEKYDRQVACATYCGKSDTIHLHFEHGVTYIIPRQLLQGLADANPRDLNNIELLGRGTGLYWPALDVAHQVSGLLAGIYGSAKWMKHLQLEYEANRMSA